MDVQVGTTDTTCLYFELCSRYQHTLLVDHFHLTYEDIVLTKFGEGDFDNAELFWLRISCEAGQLLFQASERATL